MGSKRSNEFAQLIITAVALIAVLYACYKASFKTNGLVQIKVFGQENRN